MNITNKDFQVLSDFFRWFTADDNDISALHKKALSDAGITEKQIIDDAAAVLDALHEKRKKHNAITAAYIAEKRKFNKNYARSKKQNKDA